MDRWQWRQQQSHHPNQYPGSLSLSLSLLFITIPIGFTPLSHLCNAICFSESCFLLVLSYGFEWMSDLSVTRSMIRLRQFISKHGHWKICARVCVVTELVNVELYYQCDKSDSDANVRKHYITSSKYFYSFSFALFRFFPRIFYSCDNLVNEWVCRVCYCVCCF